MTKIIMNGCNGYMGRVISQLCEADPDVQIVAGVDINTEETQGYPVFASVAECDVEADVVIDFSHVSCIDALLEHCAARNLALVLCTTGLSQEQQKKAEETWRRIPVLKSANMSLGINLLLDLLQAAAKTLAPAGFDMEIVEKHHNRKLDAPSGTALALADSINEALDTEYDYVYDRSGRREKRAGTEIGISAVRGGSIVGEHDVIFAGLDEVITFRHTAYSRAIFAKGAIQAAKFLAGKPAGHYDMRDVIKGAS